MQLLLSESADNNAPYYSKQMVKNQDFTDGRPLSSSPNSVRYDHYTERSNVTNLAKNPKVYAPELSADSDLSTDDNQCKFDVSHQHHTAHGDSEQFLKQENLNAANAENIEFSPIKMLPSLVPPGRGSFILNDRNEGRNVAFASNGHNSDNTSSSNETNSIKKVESQETSESHLIDQPLNLQQNLDRDSTEMEVLMKENEKLKLTTREIQNNYINDMNVIFKKMKNLHDEIAHKDEKNQVLEEVIWRYKQKDEWGFLYADVGESVKTTLVKQSD